MEKGKELYSGKAKSVYLTDEEELLILHFRNEIGRASCRERV